LWFIWSLFFNFHVL